MKFWQSYLAISVFGLLSAAAFAQQGAAKPSAAEEATVLEQIRERIVWYDKERTRALFIPEDVFGQVPYEQLPIPQDDRQGIRMWLSFLREWKSPWGHPYPECSSPPFYDGQQVPPEKLRSMRDIIAAGPVVLLVTIDATMVGYGPISVGAIYQFNEFSISRVVLGSDFPYQDPLSARAFLSEGGEIVVDGMRLCTFSPWHDKPPRKRDHYLLVGAPDDKGIFHNIVYFRVEEGWVLPANYEGLKSDGSISLESILSAKRAVGEAQEP